MHCCKHSLWAFLLKVAQDMASGCWQSSSPWKFEDWLRTTSLWWKNHHQLRMLSSIEHGSWLKSARLQSRKIAYCQFNASKQIVNIAATDSWHFHCLVWFFLQLLTNQSILRVLFPQFIIQKNTQSLADLFVSHYLQLRTYGRKFHSELSGSHRRNLHSQFSDEGLYLLIQVVQVVLTCAILHLPYSDVAQARLVARCPLLTSRTSPQHKLEERVSLCFVWEHVDDRDSEFWVLWQLRFIESAYLYEIPMKFLVPTTMNFN